MYSSNKESRLVLFASVLLFRAGNALAPFLLLCGAIAILVVISVLFFSWYKALHVASLIITAVPQWV